MKIYAYHFPCEHMFRPIIGYLFNLFDGIHIPRSQQGERDYICLTEYSQPHQLAARLQPHPLSPSPDSG
jgi:hypothetical protein